VKEIQKKPNIKHGEKTEFREATIRNKRPKDLNIKI
jgi:hypothetical protein